MATATNSVSKATLISIIPNTSGELVYWSPGEFAERHKVHRATVDRWIKDGKLGAVKVGHFTRIFPAHEIAFLNAQEA